MSPDMGAKIYSEDCGIVVLMAMIFFYVGCPILRDITVICCFVVCSLLRVMKLKWAAVDV